MLWLEGLSFLLDILLMLLIFSRLWFLTVPGCSRLDSPSNSRQNQNLAVQLVRIKLCQKMDCMQDRLTASELFVLLWFFMATGNI